MTHSDTIFRFFWGITRSSRRLDSEKAEWCCQVLNRINLWSRHLDEGDASLLQKAAAIFVRVGAGVNDPCHTGIDDHLGACNARLVGHIDHAACSTHPVERGLYDCVLFGVEWPYAVPVDNQVAHVVAVGQAGWRTVVAGSQYAPVADDYRAHMGSIACAARGHGKCNLEEVLIP